MRVSTAAALALALATVPLVADWCAVSCESAHAVESGAAANSVPACHHQSAPAPRVGQVPAPCGHDHHPVVVDAATTVALRAVPAIFAAGVSIDDPIARVVAAARAPAHDASNSPPLPLTLATILRV